MSYLRCDDLMKSMEIDTSRTDWVRPGPSAFIPSPTGGDCIGLRESRRENLDSLRQRRVNKRAREEMTSMHMHEISRAGEDKKEISFTKILVLTLCDNGPMTALLLVHSHMIYAQGTTFLFWNFLKPFC